MRFISGDSIYKIYSNHSNNNNDDDNNNNNNNNSIELFITNALGQEPKGQLQREHNFLSKKKGEEMYKI